MIAAIIVFGFLSFLGLFVGVGLYLRDRQYRRLEEGYVRSIAGDFD